MTFDDLVPLWHSPRNAPDPAQVERYKADIVTHLGKEYRGFLWHVGTAVALTIFVAGGFAQYVRSGGAFDFQHEWASIVLLLLPIGVALLFVRGFLEHRRRHSRYELSIVEGLRALVDENRIARARLRVSMAVLTGAMALVPLLTHQLQIAGKQRPQEAASMLLAFGMAYVAAMIWQVLKYRKLGPEGARLQGLVASYRE
jgi:MFS family permease